jgi:hypothetical protein
VQAKVILGRTSALLLATRCLFTVACVSDWLSHS